MKIVIDVGFSLVRPQFQPTQVTADFEEASIVVFGNDVTVSGCWFHFAQVLQMKSNLFCKTH